MLKGNPILSRGGGGGHFHWVCATRETPIFSRHFPLQSISFSQMTNKSAPEHHHFTVFAAPETIIFKISSPKSRSVAARRRLTAGRPNEREAFWQRPGVTAGQRASQTRRTINQLRRPAFHAQARSRAPHFHARAAPEPPPPIFHFAVAHIGLPTKMWGECPSPRAFIIKTVLITEINHVQVWKKNRVKNEKLQHFEI